MKKSSPEIIYVHGSDSGSDADVNEILASAPVTSAARSASAVRSAEAVRSAKAALRFSLPPAIPRMMGERSDKKKPDPSPVTVRPIKMVRPNNTARDLFGTKGAIALSAASPSRPLTAATATSTSSTRRQGAAAAATSSTRRQGADDSDFDSPVSKSVSKPAKAPLGWSRHHEATVTTHPVLTQLTPGDDSDSDYVESARKPRADMPTRSSPIMLRPMFDTVVSVVWKRDHHTHERLLKAHVKLTATNAPEDANPPRTRRSTSEETVDLTARIELPSTNGPDDANPPRKRRSTSEETVDLTTDIELTSTNAPNHSNRPPTPRSTAEETVDLTRRPLSTAPDVPEYYVSNHLAPAMWPPTIARLAANFNPTNITFPSLDPESMCGCDAPRLGDCRYRTCANARDGIFCDVYWKLRERPAGVNLNPHHARS